MIWVAGPDKGCTFFNKSWLAFTGRTMEQELGNGWIESVHPDDLDRCMDTYSSSFYARRSFQMEIPVAAGRTESTDGCWSTVFRGVESGGVFAGYIGSCVDITDLKRTQEEALAKQKLESVGTLAGGIAHDFNNLLGGILAHSELALAELASGSPPEEELQRIRVVAIRGAEIVRQLMIYAGQESEMSRTGRCFADRGRNARVAQSVRVETRGRWKPIWARIFRPCEPIPRQIRQVVMNLITNASEAIGDRDGVIR